MADSVATPIQTGDGAVRPGTEVKATGKARPAGVLLPWLRAQSINVTRHAAALRPFNADEFGTGAEAPTAGHIQAVNKLITGLRSGLLNMSGKVSKATAATLETPSTE